MSGKSSGSSYYNTEEDENFTWQDYLEKTNTEEVSNICFPHVEQSLKSCFQEGMYLEMPDKSKPNKFWPAVIKMTSGPLLSLCYVGPKNMPEFWCDLEGGKVDIKPLGYCNELLVRKPGTRVCLEPPDDLLEEFPEQNWQEFLSKTTKDKVSVPAELIAKVKYTAVERIEQGMQVEVEDDKNPLHHWVATVIENVGGRLLLRYNTPTSNSKDFWLFYTSPRLFRICWADEKGTHWEYFPPSCTKVSVVNDQWSRVLCNSLESRNCIPSDIFHEDFNTMDHGFKVGMKLEAVHPINKIEICPATVIKLFVTGHFLVEIDSADANENDRISWICKLGDKFIFPAGWCNKNKLSLTHPTGWTTDKEEFDWEEYLTYSNAQAAPESCFPPIETAVELGFDVGLKLEAVNPEHPNQICAATIKKVVKHLFWLHLDSEDSYRPPHVVHTESTEIFPVGWCESNCYPMKPPLNFHLICETKTGMEPTTHEPILQQEANQKSSWCPKIYFNHKCFTGPYLSKGKLAQLPKAVGPGPVNLVLKEVLSMLISVAYKSRQVLKELQHEGPVPPNMHIDVLKAKLKTAVYRANVGIVTSADKVAEYCQAVCSKLQSCPNLFGPVLYAENCPVGCSALSKSRFTSYWTKHRKHISAVDPACRPRKRGRRKLLTRNKSHSINLSNKVIKSEMCKQVEDDQESEECLSRPDSDTGDNNKKKEYDKKINPQFEMRTRGTKLPNFALSGWSWSKDSYIPAKKKSRVSSDNTIVSRSSTERNGNKHKNKSSKETDATMQRHSILESNPILWSVSDVSNYLKQTPDCGDLATRLAEESIDGHAFMLLNLPTIQENLQLQLGAAIKLCQHIERVKFSYFADFCRGLQSISV